MHEQDTPEWFEQWLRAAPRETIQRRLDEVDAERRLLLAALGISQPQGWSAQRVAIRDAVVDGARTPREVAERLTAEGMAMTADAASVTMRRMLRRGQLARISHGVFGLADENWQRIEAKMAHPGLDFP